MELSDLVKARENVTIMMGILRKHARIFKKRLTIYLFSFLISFIVYGRLHDGNKSVGYKRLVAM